MVSGIAIKRIAVAPSSGRSVRLAAAAGPMRDWAERASKFKTVDLSASVESLDKRLDLIENASDASDARTAPQTSFL